MATDPIRVSKTTTPKKHPKDGELGFGQIFTDHMFLADFQEEKAAWTARSGSSAPRSTSSE